MWIRFNGYSKDSILQDVEAALRLGADFVEVGKTDESKSHPYEVAIYFEKEKDQ